MDRKGVINMTENVVILGAARTAMGGLMGGISLAVGIVNAACLT